MTFNLFKLKEFLIIDTLNVSMSDLLSASFINLHRIVNNHDFFSCKLYSSELNDISLLYGIVDLLVVVFQASDDKIHVLIKLFRNFSDAFGLQSLFFLVGWR